MPAPGGDGLSAEEETLSRRRRTFWIMAGVVAALDLVSKAWVFGRFDELGTSEPWRVSPLLWISQHVNQGMVWSLGSGQRFWIVLLTSLLVPAIVLIAYSCRHPRAPLWALGLLLGGATANLYDRLFYRHPVLGYGVRDFLDLRNPWTGENLWPVFNVADIGIVAGVLVFGIWSFFNPEEPEQKQ